MEKHENVLSYLLEEKNPLQKEEIVFQKPPKRRNSNKNMETVPHEVLITPSTDDKALLLP
ncbi:hypothetical protein [Bacillus salipaludis]|uniref:hypothetical protein n=1 Tax=Bacillus salipaludis TaxID=2547811 RepID=UPI002E1BB00E|nr:hypothetical protein [Bacillus salipaludis]